MTPEENVDAPIVAPEVPVEAEVVAETHEVEVDTEYVAPTVVPDPTKVGVNTADMQN